MSRINKHISGFERHGSDFYRSPKRAIDPLIKHFPELRKDVVYEGGAGDGRLSEGLIHHGCKVIASDLVQWPNAPAYIEPGVDFLELSKLPDECRWAVMNPPYRQAQQFIEHALDLGVQRVHALLSANFLCAKRRSYLRDRLCQPIIQMGRLRMLPPGVEDKGQTPTTDFVWFSFDNVPATSPWMVFENIDDKAPLHT